MKFIACRAQLEAMNACYRRDNGGEEPNPKASNVPGRCFKDWRLFRDCVSQASEPRTQLEYEEVARQSSAKEYVCQQRELERVVIAKQAAV